MGLNMEWYENKNLRTYKTKTFQKSFIERRTQIHQSYIHYDNSIRKIGSGGKLRSVDKTWLEFDNKFYYEYANDPVDAPKYSDGIIKYTTWLNNLNYTIEFQPICSSVLGVIDGKDIIYSNAFGDGIDLILRSTSNGLQKLVKISESVKADKEYKFRFKINIIDKGTKQLKILNISKSNKDSYSEVTLNQTNKTLDISDKYLLISKNNNDDGIIIPTPKVWDTPNDIKDKNIENVGFDLIWDSATSSYYLEKIISNTFMRNSVGDVYTDTEVTIDMTENMATLVANANGFGTAAWNSIYNQTANYSKRNTSNYDVISIYENKDFILPDGGIIESTCAYIWWPMSEIHGFTINSASVTIKSAINLFNGDYGSDPSGHGYWTFLDSTISNYNGASILGSDFNSTNKNVICLNNYSMNDRVAGELLTFNLNSTGISQLQDVADNSTSEWGCRFSDGFFLNSTVPTWTGEPTSGNMSTQYNIENLTNGFEPYLTIDYTLNSVDLGGRIGLNTIVTFY